MTSRSILGAVLLFGGLSPDLVMASDVFGFAPVPAESYVLKPQADSTRIHLDWQVELPHKIYFGIVQTETSSPLVHGDWLLVGTTRHAGVHVYNRHTGRLLEVWPTSGGVEATITWSTDHLAFYVADSEGVLYRFAEDGTEVWRYEVGETLRATPVVDGNTAYFQTLTGQVGAVDCTTGKWLWSYGRQLPDTPSILGSSGVSVAEGVVYAGFADGYVAAIRSADGGVLWEVPVVSQGTYRDVDSLPVIAGQCLIVSGFEGPTRCLNPATGGTRWISEQGGLGVPLVAGDQIILAGARSKVVALALSDGALRWTWEAPKNATWSVDKQVINSPVLWKDGILVSTSRGRFHYLAPDTGLPLWSYIPWQDVMGFGSTPSIEGESIYTVSGGGELLHLVGNAYRHPSVSSRGEEWQGVPALAQGWQKADENEPLPSHEPLETYRDLKW